MQPRARRRFTVDMYVSRFETIDGHPSCLRISPTLFNYGHPASDSHSLSKPASWFPQARPTRGLANEGEAKSILVMFQMRHKALSITDDDDK